MSHSVIIECDGCGCREERDDYGLPRGWVNVKAHTPYAERAEALGEYCEVCAVRVNAAELAARGRPWNPSKPAKRGKTVTPDPDETELFNAP